MTWGFLERISGLHDHITNEMSSSLGSKDHLQAHWPVQVINGM